LNRNDQDQMKLNHAYWIPLVFLISGFTGNIPGAGLPSSPLEGRWDLTISIKGKDRPAWLEIQISGLRTLVGRFVGSGGSARPISKISVENGRFSFTIPPQWENSDRDLQFEGALEGDVLKGTMVYVDGNKYDWTGVRAPRLRRAAEPVWGKPVVLLDEKSLKGWHATGENQWVVEDGILRSKKSGSNLITDAKFTDFKLHIEFRYGSGSNSGVYLRGRYEVQIEDGIGKDPWADGFGAVYGFLVPSEMAAKGSGEWQSFDVTLVGRMVTIVANGVTIVCNQEIPGITGGAIDSKEGEPGPLLLQGDHGPIDYRNIVITPAQ